MLAIVVKAKCCCVLVLIIGKYGTSVVDPTSNETPMVHVSMEQLVVEFFLKYPKVHDV